MDLPKRFEELPTSEQERVRRAGDQMGRYAFQHCAAVLVAPPPNCGPGRINNGSAFILRLDSRYYLGTAWHVVQAWQLRTAAGERLLFQVGHADLPPTGRLVWHDEVGDIAFLMVDEFDVQRIGIMPCESVLGWPPPKPAPGERLLFAGYPGSLREHGDDGVMDFGSFTGLVSATSVRDRYVVAQFQREHLISNDGRELPPVGADLGGMSGGPVFLVKNLVYPLAGIITQHNSEFELMQISTLDHVPPAFEPSHAA